MISPRSFVSFILLVFVMSAGPGCDPQDGPDVVKRPGEPDMVRMEGDDAEMNRAKEQARKTHQELVEALQAKDPDHSGYAVKKPFPTPEGGEEHIWISDVTWDGRAFSGTIGNEPVDTKAVKFGDPVSVKPDELSDWMYIDGQTVVGGYTLRVMHYRQTPADQKAFTDQTGLIVPPIDF